MKFKEPTMTKEAFFAKWPKIQAEKYIDGNGAYWLIEENLMPQSLKDDIRDTIGVWLCGNSCGSYMMRMDHDCESTYTITCKSGKATDAI
jgi:hypothetical protein